MNDKLTRIEQLIAVINQSIDSGIEQKTIDLLNWLQYQKKQDFEEILKLFSMYHELVELQYEIMNPTPSEPQSQFFPFSTTAKISKNYVSGN